MYKTYRTYRTNWRKLLSLDTFSVLTILLVGLLFFRKALFPAGVFISGDVGGSDFADFFLPVKTFLTRSLAAKQFPLWTDKVGFGFPMLAEGQIQAFLPTSIIFLFLPIATAYNLSIFLAVLGIGVSTYLFLRKGLELHPLPALFGAVAFGFGAPITMRWKHLSILSVLAFFPLEMLVVKRLFRDHRFDLCRARVEPEKSVGFILGMAVLLGLQFLAGHPQMTAYCLVVSGLYFLFNLVETVFLEGRLEDENEPFITNREISLSLKLGAVFVLAILLGLALGAVQLLPSLELKGQSLRASGSSYKEAQIYPFFLKYLVTLLVPFSFGDPSKWAPYLEFDSNLLVWEICAYSGLFTAILGIFGLALSPGSRPAGSTRALHGSNLFLRGSEPEVPESDSRLCQETDSLEPVNPKGFPWCGSFPSAFFTFLLIFSALQARFNFLYFIPLFSSFRVPARFVIFVSFGLAVLSALFLEELVFNQVLPRWEELEKPPFLENLTFVWAGHLSKVLLLVLVLILVSDLYFNLGSYNQTVAASDWWATPRSVSFLERKLKDFRILPLLEQHLANSIYSKQRGWKEDPEAFLDCQELVPANRSLVWDIPSGSIYVPVGVSRANNLLGFIHKGFQTGSEAGKLNPTPGMGRLLSLGAVRYVLSPLEIEGEDFETVFSSDLDYPDSKIWVSEVKEALPRARFVSEAKFVSSEGEGLGYILRGLVDPRRTVVLERTQIEQMGTDETDNPLDLSESVESVLLKNGPSAEIIEDKDQRVTIKVKAPNDGYLVLSDTYYPGWKAYMRRTQMEQMGTDGTDGEEVRILRANYNFRAVPIPKGEHTVTFVYEPESFKRGLTISIISLGLLVGLFVYWRRHRSC